MKKQSSENYLDQLLHSVGGETEENRTQGKEKNLDPLQVFEQELFGESESPEKLTARNEEDFLREFEAELLTDDIPDFEGEQLLTEERPRPKRVGMEETDAAINGMLDHMDSFSGQLVQDPGVDENAEFDGPVPGEPMYDTEEEAAQAASEEHLDAVMDVFSMGLTDGGSEGEVDLSGMGGADLMDLLSGQEGMEDLGDLLNADGPKSPVGDDTIDNYAEAELQAQMQSADPEAEEKGNRKKKRKKKKKEKGDETGKRSGGGFFSKFGKTLFGEDTPDGEVSIYEAPEGVDVSQLSDENLQILKELEGAQGEESADGDKKKKSKKEKKPKAAKPPKPPKPAKPPKPKKEKKPKEKDNTPPLPKGPVRAIVLMVASLFGLILLGSNLLSYQSGIDEAKALYASGSYADAYAALSGLKIKEKDQKLYNQLSVLAPASAEYNSYLVFANAGSKPQALDALICAYGRYELNRDRAKEFECLGEYEILGSKVIRSLLQDFEMTGNEAMEIYSARSRKEYTLRLNEKCKSLGLE